MRHDNPLSNTQFSVLTFCSGALLGAIVVGMISANTAHALPPGTGTITDPAYLPYVELYGSTIAPDGRPYSAAELLIMTDDRYCQQMQFLVDTANGEPWHILMEYAAWNQLNNMYPEMIDAPFTRTSYCTWREAVALDPVLLEYFL